jgi:GntR family transcriptional regulator
VTTARELPPGHPSRDPSLRIDRASPLPLWAQVLTDLRARLAAGDFHREFPSDKELVGEYAVSRQTIREAVRHLSDDGVLTRQRGRGTRLSPQQFEHVIGSLDGMFRRLQAQGATATSLVRDRKLVRDAPAAAALELSARSPLVYIERVRVVEGEPLALDQSWLPASLAEGLLEAPLTHGALYDELPVPITGGRERIRPVVPSALERRTLRVAAGVGAFEIERLVLSHERPVEWRRSLVRGDRYSIVVELTAPARELPWVYEA